MPEIILIVHDIRSCHNVGSFLRTAEGLGVSIVYFTGYTPYPATPDDTRLPHITAKLTSQISKTSLGTELSQRWQNHDDINKLLATLKSDGYSLVALEQAPNSIPLQSYKATDKLALLIGREVEGIEPELLNRMDAVIEIAMQGQKESFNVVQAAAMALYQIRFH